MMAISRRGHQKVASLVRPPLASVLGLDGSTRGNARQQQTEGEPGTVFFRLVHRVPSSQLRTSKASAARPFEVVFVRFLVNTLTSKNTNSEMLMNVNPPLDRFGSRRGRRTIIGSTSSRTMKNRPVTNSQI